MTDRIYVIADVKLFSGKEVSIIEIEREDKAISTFIYIYSNPDKLISYERILLGLIEVGIRIN